MEKKLLKYTLIVVIFFIGLSMGVSYQDNNKTRDIQKDAQKWEDQNTIPVGDDFTPVDPSEPTSGIYTKQIKHNVFSSIAKDGEYLIKKGLDLVLDKSDDLFKFIFGKK